MLNTAPYRTVLKPYGQALVELARKRPEVLCLSADLSRQCEVDLFQEQIPDRFLLTGMAEAHMMGMAGSLAREGFIPFVHTFGVFATRRPLDQIANAIAYPDLPVKIIGFMPGISSPGGPSHQAIDDVALMRALPNMTVIDVADATEIGQVVEEVADIPGPVYLRLKRGEIPVIFDESHRFSVDRAQLLQEGSDVTLVTNGMMLASCIAAARTLEDAGISAAVVNVPVIKPIDTATIAEQISRSGAVIAVENHSIIGGLGSAVAEIIAERGLAATLRRVGLDDCFAEGSKSAPFLFEKYGLSTQRIIDEAWGLVGRAGSAPLAAAPDLDAGEYAPV
ncbi:MAG: transketolase family protein [Leucobacter sp.]|nr:transketolase family protein [Leucobacter sp.]